MSNKNLTLWNEVKTPDPKYTKSVNMRGGFTATSPQYLIRLATEQFGSYGSGFGLCESEFDYQLVAEFRLAIHKSTFFYVLDGKRSEFPITNTVEVVSKNGHVDTDYAKKAETNTLCKALSKIGFAADVYMGMFDDGEYMAEVRNEQAIKDASDKDAERAKQAQELTNEVDKVISQINDSRSLSELEGLYKSLARKLKDKDESMMLQLVKAKDAVKLKLEGENATI